MYDIQKRPGIFYQFLGLVSPDLLIGRADIIYAGDVRIAYPENIVNGADKRPEHPFTIFKRRFSYLGFVYVKVCAQHPDRLAFSVPFKNSSPC